ncbi:MAG: glycosyltransferase family 4 protein [Desulfovibrionaceae bacterium]
MTASRPARIALLLPRLSRYGGAEGFGWRLAEALAAAGHQVDFICARAEADPPPGVRAVTVGRLGPCKWTKLLWFVLAAERARAKGGYDLAIGLGKCLRQDVFRQGGGPLAVFWERSVRAWPAGASRALKMLRRRLSPANAIARAVEARQARTTPVIVANSFKAREWMLAAHPDLPPDRVRVIFNPPDLARFAPPEPAARAAARARLGLAEGQRAVLFAGTNFPLKGLGTCIRALARLPERFRLLVAGGRGPGRFARLAADLGVAERVRFLGRVEDMGALYGACDAFALPSFFDACSNAVMEALACGLRTVSSADNGSSHFLPPEQVLADPADDAALAAALLALEAAPPPGPFVWPADLPEGLRAWEALVDELLQAKETA